jgi:predicted dehydrogenase
MKNKHRIALVGYGYWGKIIHKNLLSLNFNDITIFDQVLGNLDKLDDGYDCYFIITPFTSHFEILKKIGDFKNKKIWCEKPLVDSEQNLEFIYDLMSINNNRLFVDWIYTFNPAINYIKDLLSNKTIKQVILNRTNDGPVRTDCSSIWDLSSHDLSILYTIFGLDFDFDLKWQEFSLKTHEDFGSNISWSYSGGMQVIINSSWQHKDKNRISLFITKDDDIIVFDDTKKIVVTDSGEIVNFSRNKSPLELAIKNFFSSDEFELNYEMTKKITKNISNAI